MRPPISTDNRILDERLKAARSNVRFGLVSGQLSKKRLPEGAAIPFLISCWLSAASIRFLGMLFPPRNSHSLHPPTTGGTSNDTAGVAWCYGPLSCSPSSAFDTGLPAGFPTKPHCLLRYEDCLGQWTTEGPELEFA